LVPNMMHPENNRLVIRIRVFAVASAIGAVVFGRMVLLGVERE
jgi:hypothetical protein